MKPKEDDRDPPPTPPQEVLRRAARMLHERRLQSGTGEEPDPTIENLADNIRQRTTLTLKQAHSAPGHANAALAREMDIQQQHLRLEDLRRTFDLLHAEHAGKSELYRVLSLQLVAGRPGPFGGQGAAVAGSKQGSPTRGISNDPNPSLDAMGERVRGAQEELREIQHSCEMLAFMEDRLRVANHCVEADLDKLKAGLDNLAREEEEIRALGDDASEAVRNTRRQLSLAREAHAAQQRAYDDCRSQRKMLISDKRKGAQREKAFEEREKHARLDGLGELDAEAEEQLRQAEKNVQVAKVTTHMERETALEDVSRAEAIFNRLRRSAHDPESIATPQDLLVTLLSAKDRALELQGQVDKSEELSRQLTLELQRLQNELQHCMYFGSSSQVLAEAEREFEPSIAAATALMETRQRRCATARNLVHDSKMGISLLHQLTHHESLETLPTDSDIPTVLERVERHLVACLATIGQVHARPYASTSRTGHVRSVPESATEVAEPADAVVEESQARDLGASTSGATVEKAILASETKAPPPSAPHPPSLPNLSEHRTTSATTSRFAHNLRVLTQEQVDERLDSLPEDDPEGYDDDGTELLLTRRSAVSKRRTAAGRSAAASTTGQHNPKQQKQPLPKSAVHNRGGASRARAAPS